MNDDELVAYLSGEATASVDPDKRAELDELRRLLSDEAAWVEPQPGLQERIVEAIASTEATPTMLEAGPAPAGMTDDRAAVVELRPRRIRYAILGAAATVLLVVGVAIGLTRHGDEAIQFQATLQGTDLAPQASGQVTVTRTVSGWKIHLQADGLPRLDNGAYYEAWLKNEAGDLVPTGTFNRPDDVTLWAGVPPSGYPIFTITRQLANGNPASSGQVVLVGMSHPSN